MFLNYRVQKVEDCDQIEMNEMFEGLKGFIT
jgi:hypothetical protein